MKIMTETELKGLIYVEGEGLQYNLLYPLLDGHWNKSLDEMPEELRPRVKYAVPKWNDLDSSESSAHDHVCVYPSTRQQWVKYHDMKYDLTQEQSTDKRLGKYLGEELPFKILQAEREGQASVVVLLRHKVNVQLQKIRKKEGIHWPNEYPLLWKALYLFQKSLIGMRDKTLEGDDCILVLALDNVVVDVHKILNIDRYRVESKVVSDCEAGTVEQAVLDTSLLTLTKSKTNDAPPGRMPKTAIGRLAIKAAFQIECETKRSALVGEVIKMLQSWVEHEEVLIEEIRDGVKWQTGGLKDKDFDVGACSKALERWHKSRH